MKERLDVLLVERGLAPSREKAKRMIMAGDVFVDNQREDKAGTRFDTSCAIRISGETLKYVSRGGFKLEKALDVFAIDLSGKDCLDIGASTGGFTDCMIQHNAAYVAAVDVGYGQLAWKLRQDARVCCMERQNFRYMTREDFDRIFDFASADVAFISLAKIFPAARTLIKEDGDMVALIKPQFEAGKDKVGKKGVVTDKKVHLAVIENVIAEAEKCGFIPKGLSFSPIKGPEGNIEYLLYIGTSGEAAVISPHDVIGEAHEAFSDHSL